MDYPMITILAVVLALIILCILIYCVIELKSSFDGFAQEWRKNPPPTCSTRPTATWVMGDGRIAISTGGR